MNARPQTTCGAARLRLPDRRESRRHAAPWPTGNSNITVYVDVGFGMVAGEWLALEVFLVTGKTGTMLNQAAHDLAEMISLMLQLGHSIDELKARFKPGSLADFAMGVVDELDLQFREEQTRLVALLGGE